MMTRVLIVMLAVLNMGVALWWWLRPQPTPSLPTLATDVAVLELLAPSAQSPITWAQNFAETDTDIGDIAAIIPIEETPPEVLNQSEPTIPPCVSLGPFTEMAQVQAALRALGSDVERYRLREVVVPADTRYRILIPPAPTRELAQAEVDRIAAAGFSDYFIINEGKDIHAIALGQFRNRQGAENRLAQLRAAGFAAQLNTTTEVPHSNWWIDTTPIANVTPTTLQQRSSAAQWQVLDCARLR